MPYEVEMKFRCTNADLPRQTAIGLGARPGGRIQQADRYFNHPSRDFEQTDEAFRIRDDGRSLCVTYKGPKIDADTKTRREIEIPIGATRADLELTSEMFVALGFRIVATVRKSRERWELNWEGSVFEISVDSVEGIGEFVELETSADESTLPAARERLLRLADVLGLKDSERGSYLGMLLATEANRA